MQLLEFYCQKYSFSCSYQLLVFNPVCSSSRCLTLSQISVTLLIPPCLRAFSNIDIFRILILKFLYNRSKLLYCLFKHFTIINICHINTTYPISQFIDEFFFFLAIFDNSLFSVLVL